MSIPPSVKPELQPFEPEPRRTLARGALAALLVLGGVVGLFAGLQATRVVSLGPLHVSLGALAAFVLNAGFGALGAWALRSRDAAFAPGVGWFLAVVGLLFLPHPGGDIVIPGSGADAVAFLLAGIAGVVVAGVASARILPRAASLQSRSHR